MHGVTMILLMHGVTMILLMHGVTMILLMHGVTISLKNLMFGVEVRPQAGTGKELDSNLGRVST